MIDAAIDVYGVAGLTVLILAHLAYDWYQMRRGRMKEIAQNVDEAHSRLDGVGIVLYRQAEEEWDDVDEDEIRDMLFDGEEVTFPSDIEEPVFQPGGDD